VGLSIEIGVEVRGRVRLGLAVLDALSIGGDAAALGAEIDAAALELRQRHAGRPASEVPGVSEARALYRALGVDPTRTRPSNEALLRRVLKGDTPYRVNALVDAVNLVSLRRQLPFGLYDLDRIESPVELRLGREGESYEGIRKGEIRVAGRPVLADAIGPFGNPSADSARTRIRVGTRRALVVAYGPARLAPAELAAAVGDAVEVATRHCEGTALERRLLPAESAPVGWS
jgi:DNA/RNA-binding domain of Phe-tRNA-synthetase-like protein